MTLPFPLTLTDRFAWIIRELHAAVAARIKFPPVTATIIVHICARLRRFAVEFETLAANVRAGTYVARPVGRRRAARRTSRNGHSPVRTHYELGLPPRQPGWLHRIAPNTAGVWAGALRDLFSDPEMAALIADVPRLRRILRPLCFMLGLEGGLLRPAAPTPRAPAADGEDSVAPPARVAAGCAPTAETGAPRVAAPCRPRPVGGFFQAA